MILIELYERIEKTLNLSLRNAELEVVVVRRDPGIGGHPHTKIKHAGAGFDWDHGKFQLWPEEPVFKHNDEDQIKALRAQLDDLARENLGLRTQLRHFQNLVKKQEKDLDALREGSPGSDAS